MIFRCHRCTVGYRVTPGITVTHRCEAPGCNLRYRASGVPEDYVVMRISPDEAERLKHQGEIEEDGTVS